MTEDHGAAIQGRMFEDGVIEVPPSPDASDQKSTAAVPVETEAAEAPALLVEGIDSGVKVPDAIRAIAERITLQAEKIGRTCGLRSPGVVQRLLYARYIGITNVTKIAQYAGISRSQLTRYIQNGRDEQASDPDGKQDCYRFFVRAWDQLHQATVNDATENFRRSATTAGNWKAAQAFLERVDPTAPKNAPPGGDVNIGALQVNISERSTEELLDMAAGLIKDLPEQIRDQMTQQFNVIEESTNGRSDISGAGEPG